MILLALCVPRASLATVHPLTTFWFPGMLEAYFGMVGWPMFLATSDRPQWCAKVEGATLRISDESWYASHRHPPTLTGVGVARVHAGGSVEERSGAKAHCGREGETS